MDMVYVCMLLHDMFACWLIGSHSPIFQLAFSQTLLDTNSQGKTWVNGIAQHKMHVHSKQYLDVKLVVLASATSLIPGQGVWSVAVYQRLHN